jgi:hypothetical protein
MKTIVNNKLTLKTYILPHAVNFPTRVQNSWNTAIDNMFVDSARLNSSYTARIINGLWDHDAQFPTISGINTDINLTPFKWRLRKINNETLAELQRLLANETWELIFKNWDTKYKLNLFLDMFLKVFEATFPVQNKSLGETRNDWITQEIKISCRYKGVLNS